MAVAERGRLASGQPSRTADMNAALRAAEAKRPPEQRLFHDPYARYFVQRPGLKAVCAWGPVARTVLGLMDRRFSGATGEIILRNRYWEEALEAALAGGIRQVVLIGAGYDSTALRRSFPDDAVVYEVDAPPTQDSKLRTMERRGLEAPEQVRFVPCNLEFDSAHDGLVAAGFDPQRPSVFCWLGVSYYVPDEGIGGVLDDLARLSAPGSRLVMDYMDDSVIAGTTQSPGAINSVRLVEKRGEPYRFGRTPDGMAELLTESGFTMVDHARLDDLSDRYAGGHAWCRTDDWIRVLTAERAG